MVVRYIFTFVAIWLTLVGNGLAQSFPNSPLHLHNFNNYYILNPAIASFNGDPFVTLTFHRQQIGNFENVPTQGMLTYTSPVNVQNPLKHFIGANVYNFSRSIWSTTGGWASYAYEIQLPFSDINTLRLGISAGLEADALGIDDETAINDPAIQSRIDNSIRPVGQFGIYYLQKHWEFGAGLPRLFATQSGDNTQESKGLKPFNNWFFSTAYEFNFRYIMFLKPMVIYRSFENMDSNIEVNATLSYQKQVWLNASWFQNYGMAVGAGAQFHHGKYSVSYAYKFNNQENSFQANPAHEIQLRMNLRRQADLDARLLNDLPQVDTTQYALIEDPIEEDTASIIEPDTITIIEQPDTAKVEVEVKYMNYVIIGSFLEDENADKLIRQFKRKHNVEAQKRFNTANKFYNVYILETGDFEVALAEELRAKEEFEIFDAWILRVPIPVEPKEEKPEEQPEEPNEEDNSEEVPDDE